jgi:hypothetical protein
MGYDTSVGPCSEVITSFMFVAVDPDLRRAPSRLALDLFKPRGALVCAACWRGDRSTVGDGPAFLG